MRHAALNDIIHRSLTAAEAPSRLESPSLLRTNGKRPDWMTLVWKSGYPLALDATCPDTFATSNRGRATAKAGDVAARAEDWKLEKYRNLAPHHIFQPVAIYLWSNRPKLPFFSKVTERSSGQWIRRLHFHQSPTPEAIYYNWKRELCSYPGDHQWHWVAF